MAQCLEQSKFKETYKSSNLHAYCCHRFLQNQRVKLRAYASPPPVPVLWKTNPVKPSYFTLRRNILLSSFCRGLVFQSYLFLSFFPNKFLGTSLLSHSLQTPRSSIPSLEHHNNLWWGTQIMQGKMANDNFSQQSVQLSSVYTAKLAVSATDNLLYKLWMDFQQIWFLGTSLKFLDIFIFMLTQNINNGHFTGRHACIFALTFSVPRNTSQPVTFRKK